MVEQSLQLNAVFASLADATRRDILRRVLQEELSIGEIAESYDLTFAAISKHLQVLEKAKLILKRRRGKQQFVTASPETIQKAEEYLKDYQRLWNERFDSLEVFLRTQ